MRKQPILIASAIALVLTSTPAIVSATTINGITLTGQNIFADYRSLNDVHIAQGFVLQFGGNIAGGSEGYSGAGIFTPAPGATIGPITQTLAPCGPLSTNLNFCARTSALPLIPNDSNPNNPPSVAATDKLAGSWSFKVQSPTSAVATFALPSSTVIPAAPTPSPQNVTIQNSANGIQPTISWTLPTGFAPDSFRIQIYDREVFTDSNSNDIIHSAPNLPPTTTSYTFPTILSTGQTLEIGHKYTIDFQAIVTRDGTSNSPNSNILTRSNSFFDFTPQLKSVAPDNIALPQVDGVTGVYHFQVNNVGPDSISFIDPDVAIGYIFDIGLGDPNFASVLLPNVGDGVFDIAFLSEHHTLNAGSQFFFPIGGVSEFTVTGIETSAGLDPADTSAFVTGLTFVNAGSFTGTMTPITQDVSDVPEPASLTMLITGLLGLQLIWRRRKAS